MDVTPFAPPFAWDGSYALLAVCVGVAYTVEATMGFGAILISLTLGAWLYAVPDLLPLLLPQSILFTSVMVWRQRRHVDLPLLLGRILPWMAPGVGLGFGLFSIAPTAWFAPGLGAFVVGVAGLELWRMFTHGGSGPRPLGRVRFAGASFGAGVVQGMAGTGGPVLVYALGREGLDKSRFRATLAFVWLILNLGLVASYVVTGRLVPATVPYVAGLVPVLAGAFALGDRLHHRLDEERFERVVLVMLVGAGAALLV